MRIAAVLPHLLVFGGVRRYIELGNAFVSRGHEFILYTPEGKPPDWLPFAGSARPLDSLPDNDHDVILNGWPEYAARIDGAKARLRIFYIQGENVLDRKGIITSDRRRIMVNSSGLREEVRKRYSIEPLDGIGGLNPAVFKPAGGGRPAGPFKILCYGRLSKPHKGTRFVIQAVRSMRREGCEVELQLFDFQTPDNPDPRIGFQPGIPFTFYMNLPQSALAAVYQTSDVFVSAEHRTGWCNTGAEAVACGLPLVCTKSGTEDFAVHNISALVVPYRNAFFIKRALKRLYRDRELGARLNREARERISAFTWEKVCDKMERAFTELIQAGGAGGR